MKCLVIGKRGLLDWVRNSSSSLSNRQHRSANLGMGLFPRIDHGDDGTVAIGKRQRGDSGQNAGRSLIYMHGKTDLS